MFQRKIKARISIVAKVNYRSLTGEMLGLIVHNHLNSQIHLCWSITTGTPYYKNCIQRSFICENNWLCRCKQLKIPGAVGLAACTVGGIRYVGDHRVRRCILFGRSNLGKTYCVGGALSGIPKSRNYVPLAGQFFFST